MTTNQEPERAEETFVRAFSSSLINLLTGESGSQWLIDPVPDVEPTPDGSEPVRVKLAFDGNLRGEVLLEIHRDSAAILVSHFLRQPTGEFGAEQSEALLKLIESSTVELRAEVAREYGEFTIKVTLTSEPTSNGVKPEQITLADNDSNRVSILMYLNPSLLEELSIRSTAAGGPAVTGKGMKAIAGKAIPEQVNLNLVMDVELNVTLRFGQRQLTLREVLELTGGSVVELDRQVEEPVELLLESRVIARGEAVVIDGNYGLRVTEVCQPVLSPAHR
jgi:flagellar motor switch protein FliN/FliY